MAFAFVPESALKKWSEISDGAFRLYVYYCSRRNRRSGGFKISEGMALRDNVGLTRRSYYRYKTELAQKGWIEVDGSFIKPVEGFEEVQAQGYKRMPDSDKSGTPIVTNLAPNSDKSGTPIVTNLAPNSDKSGTPYNKEVPNNIPDNLPDNTHTRNTFASLPLGEIYIESVLAGITERLEIKTLPSRLEWQRCADWTFQEGFTSDQFLECFDLLRQQNWRHGPVKPKHVIDNLTNLNKLRKEIKNQNNERAKPSGKGSKRTDADVFAESAEFYKNYPPDT